MKPKLSQATLATEHPSITHISALLISTFWNTSFYFPQIKELIFKLGTCDSAKERRVWAMKILTCSLQIWCHLTGLYSISVLIFSSFVTKPTILTEGSSGPQSLQRVRPNLVLGKSLTLRPWNITVTDLLSVICQYGTCITSIRKVKVHTEMAPVQINTTTRNACTYNYEVSIGGPLYQINALQYIHKSIK